MFVCIGLPYTSRQSSRKDLGRVLTYLAYICYYVCECDYNTIGRTSPRPGANRSVTREAISAVPSCCEHIHFLCLSAPLPPLSPCLPIHINKYIYIYYVLHSCSHFSQVIFAQFCSSVCARCSYFK